MAIYTMHMAEHTLQDLLFTRDCCFCLWFIRKSML